MKHARFTYIEIIIALIIGTFAPGHAAFAGSDMSAMDAVYAGESGEILSNLVISSFNPGFSDPYIGEFFELKNLSNTSILPAGISIFYETSGGSEFLVYTFSGRHEILGGSLLFRLASSDEVKNAEEGDTKVSDVVYARNMSQTSGRIKLKYEDTVLDSLCWGFEDEAECYAKFNSKKPTTLVREISEEEIGDFVHTADYLPTFDAENPGLVETEAPEEEPVALKCQGLQFSEILSYYETSVTEQFIELLNGSEEKIELEGCFLTYKNKAYRLVGEVEAGEYFAIYPAEAWGLTLTKNPTSSNVLEVVDTDGSTVDTMNYYSGQKKGVSLAMVGYTADGSRNWVQTYRQTPGEVNTYQQFKTCAAGKVLNLETGNCVNETTASESTLAACPEGKYRNPLTGRCKSYATTASAELKPCAEGYERNPATNRCRKIVENTGAEYPLVAENTTEKTEFVSIGAIVTVIVAGICYIAFQYKEEIRALFRKSAKA